MIAMIFFITCTYLSPFLLGFFHMCGAPNPNNEVIGMNLYLDITGDLVDLVRKDIDANCTNGNTKGNKGSRKKKNKKDKISDFPKYNIPICATFPAILLRIGDWKVISSSNAQILAKFFLTEKKIAWEIMTADLKVHKLEMDYSSVAAIKATFNRDKPSLLELELDKPPSSYAFKLVHPRLVRDWERALDFTNWNAPTHRTHYVECSEEALAQPYAEILKHDARLYELAQKSFPSSTDPFFTANGLNHPKTNNHLNPTSQAPNGVNNNLIPAQPGHLNPVPPQLPNGVNNNLIPAQPGHLNPVPPQLPNGVNNNLIPSLLDLLHPTSQLPNVFLSQLGHLHPSSSLSNVGNNNHVLSELDYWNLPPLLAPGFSQGGLNLNPSSTFSNLDPSSSLNFVFPNSNWNQCSSSSQFDPSSSQNIPFPVPNSEQNPSSNLDPSSSLNVAMTSNPSSVVNMRLNMPFLELPAWDHTLLSPDFSNLEGLAGLLDGDGSREN